MLDRKLVKQIEKNHHWAIRVLKKYVSIPSVSAQGKGLTETARFLVNLFRQCGLKARMIKSNGAPLVYAEKIISPSAKTILFYNHYDVQPAEPLDKWVSPPFKPVIRNGKLFGRGVLDNKGNFITRLSAVKSFLDLPVRSPEATLKLAHRPTSDGQAGLKYQLPVNVKFLVEGEEEISSPNLPEFVQRYRNMLKADLGIWELGGRDEKGHPHLTLGCKGILHAELAIRTAKEDMHSSRGIIVPNPAWRLLWALRSLKDEKERILIKGFYDRVRRPGKQEKTFLKRFLFNEQAKKRKWGIKNFLLGLKGERLKQRHFYEPALNINGLASGYQGKGHKTVLPCEASAKIDFRLVPNQNPADILKKLRRHLDRNGFTDVRIVEAVGYPPARTPVTNPYVGLVARAGKRIYKKRYMIEPLSAGSGPMYLFTPRMPCISMGIGHPGSNIHAPNENIYLKDFLSGTKCIAAIMQELQIV